MALEEGDGVGHANVDALLEAGRDDIAPSLGGERLVLLDGDHVRQRPCRAGKDDGAVADVGAQLHDASGFGGAGNGRQERAHLGIADGQPSLPGRLLERAKQLVARGLESLQVVGLFAPKNGVLGVLHDVTSWP